MNQALKGILATYGVEETVNTLLWIAHNGIQKPESPVFQEIMETAQSIHNDVDLLSYLMECHGVIDPETGALEKLTDIAPWRSEHEKAGYEEAAKRLRIERMEWVEQ